MKKFLVALCVLTVSLFGVLGCSKSDTSAPGGTGTETAAPTEEAPVEGGE